MAAGIELPIQILLTKPAQNPAEATEPEIVLFEMPAGNYESENGAVFFNLDWQNRQAESLRQRLATIFGDASATQNQTESLTNSTWNDLINLAKNHEDFTEFRRAPESLWQQVRQMSEPRIARDENGNQTRTASRFEELAAQMRAKKLSPDKFAETLPAPERLAFKARFQLEQTFGATVPNDDGALPDDAKQIRNGNITDSAENKLPVSGNARALVNGRETSLTAAQNLKLPAPGNPTLPNAAVNNAPQNASGNLAPGIIAPENSFVHNLNNVAAENKSNGAVNVLRDGGTVMGGALINGAFAAIENQENAEKLKVGDWRAEKNVYSEGSGFVAGASGAMFGAAIGKIIPGAEMAVSGILGFVSGVVSGVEAERGFRLLSAGEAIFQTVVDSESVAGRKQLTGENSLSFGSNRQLSAA